MAIAYIDKNSRGRGKKPFTFKYFGQFFIMHADGEHCVLPGLSVSPLATALIN